MNKSPLTSMISAQKQGLAQGIPSICSANPSVLNAAFGHAHENDLPLLIESTCNQVNQYGGYTGQSPADFMAALRRLLDQHNIAPDRLLVGGDHLGPNPWRKEPAALAMEKAKVLVRDYVRAGYTKIHLDTSMACADDGIAPLPTEVIAGRSAELALVAEKTLHTERPPNTLHYVIGTEVPAPGGIDENEDAAPEVSSVQSVEETISATRRAFSDHGLSDVWERVAAVVVQPGVEYGSDRLFSYDSQAAAHLSRYIEGVEGLVFEAHSTDYQTQSALTQLVRDHFAVLKVGPALTFAYREVIFALSLIEEAWLAGCRHVKLSNIRKVIDDAMLANPIYWQTYYPGDAYQQRYARHYSLSDRIRYYWSLAPAQEALKLLLANLAAAPIPLPLLSQFLPRQYDAVRAGHLANDPEKLIEFGITAVLDIYASACGFNS